MHWKWLCFALGATAFAYFSYGSSPSERCSVEVGYGRRSIGNRCPHQQVMTGADADYIYCSDLRVICQSRD